AFAGQIGDTCSKDSPKLLDCRLDRAMRSERRAPGRMRCARVHRFSAFAAIAPHRALRPYATRFIRMSYKRTVA
ncbi:hypothetical protein CA830_22120, partial [Burkholderia multivorans]